MRFWRTLGIGTSASLLLALAAGLGLEAADKAYPPPLEKAMVTSAEVLDSDGQLLRAFATPQGRWRLKTTAADVDPQFVRMLVAYEDRRFYEHHGVDIVAMGRAALQFVTHGRIVSGASTLSMQVARLIEPRPERTFGAKLLQLARAIQIERRLSKTEILDLYLTHAPYGGNLEGIRAASLAYFGKEPRRLTVAQSALLVALPQLPEKRRPDRHLQAAEAARKRVLTRMAVAEIVGDSEAGRAEFSPIPARRLQLPAYAAHLAEAALKKEPSVGQHHTTLKRSIQQGLEAVARESAARLDPKVSLAMVMADSRTGEIVGEVGSANYFDASRSGWIDMTRINRSPGSTLKPFIYGLAFEEGLLSQETIIEDRPADFFGYRPKNFDTTYQGDVTVRQALQLSLNVPAVRVLDAVGPSRLLVRFRRANVRPVLPANETPGLAIGLGGLGITLKDLVQLYAGLANRSNPVKLGDGIVDKPEVVDSQPLLEPVAAWNVADVLSGIIAPAGSAQHGIAYKTGTSYGYRDAWSVGYDGRYVLGVWVGRPDNGAVPGLTGYASAAPILFQAFAKSGVGITPLPSAPIGAVRIAQAQLPISQRRFSMDASGLMAATTREPAPQIVYPPEGAHVELGETGDGRLMPLVLKLQGGRAPFRWLANGKPLATIARNRTSQWTPDGDGYSTLTVIDAAGRAATVGVFLQ
ncbi:MULTISPECIES: penicillin-binding protein 1C [Rhizobium]|uniref:peptidoglycan glycosyltransferase n=1 Tax=Rhizobium rhododendri TaxID=2506430 RepID=A0ABY8IM10_9HYPH|nr:MULTISPECIES: penicillin-binding protein 1C [Rhizobium]MBZ5758399.1 penicillin-binding protein 1C [Rhizobium sp. VS19-DR96]MBZ5764771.1 penicillin-binding protein 1C [Rhizobium sp. VS19-DR129.2]MBZ5772314.1 penicillin-binding protein 1C [Rhizobium sp. VS19-DRK62.2]MBZ5782999.1 penicillin-binding protein 1C [Rhizobium sp. VS19-DR121]MBZ5800447.1 penicillin-binding protein 1C [Rhizobium sp. VS19-DR181]